MELFHVSLSFLFGLQMAWPSILVATKEGQKGARVEYWGVSIGAGVETWSRGLGRPPGGSRNEVRNQGHGQKEGATCRGS